MQVISVIECDSMDSDDLDEIERSILEKEGPTLGQIYSPPMPNLFTPITSVDFIRGLSDAYGRQVKYIGCDRQAELRAYYYLLLYIEMEERKSYPHLRTFIRQQLTKDHLLQKHNNLPVKKGQNVCELYFQQVHQWNKIQQFILSHLMFDTACMTMIKGSIKGEREKIQDIYKFVSKVFNVDCQIICQNENYQSFALGTRKRFYIIIEGSHVFVVLLGLERARTQEKKNSYNQEDKSNEEQLAQVIEASQESTPKFIDGPDDSIRYRRKSHKNSFGGQIEVISYKDLTAMNNNKPKAEKVFSARFETQQIVDLEKQPQEEVKSPTRSKNNVTSGPMRGSQFTPIIDHEIKQDPNQPDRKIRKKKLSSSAIIQQQEHQKIQFNNKISFSKHDRHRFVTECSQHFEKSPSQNNSNSQASKLSKIKSLGQDNKQLSKFKTYEIPQRTENNVSQVGDQESQLTSEAIIQLLQPTIRMKLKNRKYSYFTQQTVSSPLSAFYRKQAFGNVTKEEGSQGHNRLENKVDLMAPKFQLKRRFQENPLRFSQIADNSSGGSINSIPKAYKTNRNILVSHTVKYDQQGPAEPVGWIRKEVTYYFTDKIPQKRVYTSPNHYTGINEALTSKQIFIEGSTGKKNNTFWNIYYSNQQQVDKKDIKTETPKAQSIRYQYPNNNYHQPEEKTGRKIQNDYQNHFRKNSISFYSKKTVVNQVVRNQGFKKLDPPPSISYQYVKEQNSYDTPKMLRKPIGTHQEVQAKPKFQNQQYNQPQYQHPQYQYHYQQTKTNPPFNPNVQSRIKSGNQRYPQSQSPPLVEPRYQAYPSYSQTNLIQSKQHQLYIPRQQKNIEILKEKFQISKIVDLQRSGHRYQTLQDQGQEKSKQQYLFYRPPSTVSQNSKPNQFPNRY